MKLHKVSFKFILTYKQSDTSITITPLGSGPGEQVCDSVMRLHIDSKRWVSTECPAQIGTRPHVMDLEVPRGSKTRNVREDEFFAGSWRAGIDDENMDALGWCACIIFRRRNGRGTRESSERLSRRSNGSVLAEGEKFLVGYNANFFGGELRELLNMPLISCVSEHERKLSHISATNTSIDQHCIWFVTKNAHRRIGLLRKAHIAKWLRSSWIDRSPLPKKALYIRNESCQMLVSAYQSPSCPCHCDQRSRWHPSGPRLFWRYSWCTTRLG